MISNLQQGQKLACVCVLLAIGGWESGFFVMCCQGREGSFNEIIKTPKEYFLHGGQLLSNKTPNMCCLSSNRNVSYLKSNSSNFFLYLFLLPASLHYPIPAKSIIVLPITLSPYFFGFSLSQTLTLKAVTKSPGLFLSII